MFIILFLSILLFLLCCYFTKNHDYWAKRNVKHDKPVPFFGNLYHNVMGIKSITEVAAELYRKYPDEKVVGFYRGRTPELVIRDLDIARRILNIDFAYFHPRGVGRDPRVEPIMANLFHVDGDTWKLLRQRLTAAFTTAKLKNMFPLIIECAQKLQSVGDDIIMNKSGECDVRELMARFTTEFIGACGFGIQMDAINNENSLFREIGRKIFQRSLWNYLLVAVWHLLPEFLPQIQKLIAERELLTPIEVILKNIRAQRNNKPSCRNDFVDLLLELEAKGKIQGESVEKQGSDGKPELVELEMDTKLMAAQMFIFFAAGFETSSSATSYTLHQLAYHSEIQANIQQQIDAVLKKYDDKLCYDSISEMTLLSNAFKEAMRLFPSLGVLHRVCAKQYTIPELDITIDAGVKIMIPMQGIQTDERYFNNPMEFNPDRFDESMESHKKYAYLPFGEGPRQCIDFLPLFLKLISERELLTPIEVILKNIRAQRNKKPGGRNDFVDLLLELEAKGKIQGESVEKQGSDGKPELVELEMDTKLMAAQMFIFFAAGYETSSSATSYTLHQLAYHPEIQANIQQQIDAVLKKYDDKLCYDSISEMTLLSNAFKEAMRLFPSLGVLHRVCAKQYTIPELGITIDAGVKIMIPMQGIQTDEKYFNDPMEFKPDRFDESMKSHKKYAYLPFGEGPRQCIGARLGEMQSLAGLAVVLRRFCVRPGPRTRRQPEVNHGCNVVQSVAGGLPLRLQLRTEQDSKSSI